MRKRFMPLLLCFFLLASSIVPMMHVEAEDYKVEVQKETAVGEDVITVNGERVTVYKDSATYVNPLYEDVVNEADLKQSSDVDVVYGIGATSEYCSSLEEAGIGMRDELVAREETIEVKYQADAYHEEDLKTITNAAMEHTGNPVEGDYLKWQYAGWSARISYYISGGVCYLTVTYTLTYYTTSEQEAVVTETVEDTLESLDIDGKTDYQKIRAIYDFICENVTYDYDTLEDNTYKLKFTAYAALLNGTAVCQGYALLFYRMALELGIDARFIAGLGNGGAHGWNIVELRDEYYNLDSTWDAGRSTYSYFLKCTDNFDNHSRYTNYDTDEFNAAYPMSETDYVVQEDDLVENVVDQVADISSVRLSLADQIGLKFLVSLDDSVTKDDYMEVTMDGETTQIKVSETSTQVSSVTGKESNVFECKVNSKEMTKDITVQMVVDGQNGTPVTYSVKDYADAILGFEEGTYEDEKKMARAMLNYGGYAQEYFDGATEKLANEGLYTGETDPVQQLDKVDLSAYKHSITQAEDTQGIHLSTAALSLESETELRFYFNLDEGKNLEDYVFELKDSSKELETGYSTEKEKYYVTIPNIGPTGLQTMHTLSITAKDSTEELIGIKYSAMSYVKTVLDNSTYDDEWKDLVKALYLYNQAALEYSDMI